MWHVDGLLLTSAPCAGKLQKAESSSLGTYVGCRQLQANQPHALCHIHAHC
jgi:hypothetical protein